MSQPSGTIVKRNYASFRGVDFSNRRDEVNFYRSPDALNMWKNYKNNSGKSIETRPDVELLAEYSNTIFGLFFYEYNNSTHKIVHSGTNLYDESNVIYEGMAEHESQFFVYNNLLYIKDGTNYLVYDGETCSDVVGYIPTTSISRTPMGGGTISQDINYLSPYKKNSFCADGESTEYWLDNLQLDEEPVRVWILDENGQEVEMTTGFHTDYAEGKVYFDVAPEIPYTDGRDNVFIQYKKTIEGYSDVIKKCTLLEVFDNRVFFSGNPDYPNMLFHTSLNDPTYCSDLDKIPEGQDDSMVKGLVSGNNALWVLKEPSQSNTTIFYHNPTIDSDYGKIYPSNHSSISTGCATKGINYKDTICFYSDEGLESITSNVTTEQVITHRSSMVDSKLLNESEYKNMMLEEWEGYLLTILGNKIYLADYRQYAQVNDHYEYEWYYFEFDQNITSTRVKNGVLYLCTEETKKVNGEYQTFYRIYTLTGKDENRKVNSYWTTLEDEFNYPEYQKITNKKGCVVDMEGKEITLSAKTDNGKFETIQTYKNTKGYVVPRIKKKKWKSIQLKFSSKYPFNIYSSTLESYIGSYIKR